MVWTRAGAQVNLVPEAQLFPWLGGKDWEVP